MDFQAFSAKVFVTLHAELWGPGNISLPSRQVQVPPPDTRPETLDPKLEPRNPKPHTPNLKCEPDTQNIVFLDAVRPV